MLTQYASVVAPDGSTAQQAAAPFKSTAEMLKRWRQMVDNTRALGGEAAAQLASAGWSAERLALAGALVEAYAAADTGQQTAIQAYQEAAAQFGVDLQMLQTWYGRAARLIKIAIKDADPFNQTQLRDLLGLGL